MVHFPSEMLEKIFLFFFSVRHGAGGGRRDEPNDGVDEAVRLDLQQQVVHRDIHHSLPQQERPFRGENQEIPSVHLLPGIQR